MTTREVGADYRERQRYHSNGPLWKAAFGQAAHICETYHRGRAIKRLRMLRRRFRHMAISTVFANAARDLSERRRW